MRIPDNNTQTPCQVAAAMQSDARITQAETNRNVNLAERAMLPMDAGTYVVDRAYVVDRRRNGKGCC